MLLAGEYQGVLDQAAAFMTTVDVPRTDLAWAAVLACRAAGAMGEWGRVAAWAERGFGLSPEPEAAGWLNLLSGTALMYIGDPYQSRVRLLAFVQAAQQENGLQRLLPDGLFNLGCLMRLLGDTEAEASYFRRAAAAYQAAGRSRQELLSRLELACCYLLQGNAPAAEPELERAEADLPQHGDMDLDGFLQTCLALYCRVRGDLMESRRLCEELLARPDLPGGSRADVGWILARNALEAGDWEGAGEWLDQAYEDALRHWSPPQLRRIAMLKDQLAAKQVGR